MWESICLLSIYTTVMIYLHDLRLFYILKESPLCGASFAVVPDTLWCFIREVSWTKSDVCLTLFYRCLHGFQSLSCLFSVSRFLTFYHYRLVKFFKNTTQISTAKQYHQRKSINNNYYARPNIYHTLSSLKKKYLQIYFRKHTALVPKPDNGEWQNLKPVSPTIIHAKILNTIPTR